MKPIRVSALAAILFGACFTSYAQLATWDIAGSNAGTTNPDVADTLATNLASASLTLGSGLSASAAADTFGGSGFNSTSLAAAIASNQYLGITITPQADYAISLSSIFFTTGVSSATTSFHGELLSSATGFAPGNSLHTYSFSTTTPPSQSITLSGISALQNIVGPIEFRIYGWRDTAGTTTFRIRNLSGNDLVINGSITAVPEPATYAVLLGALVLLVAVGRRRWAHADT